MYKQNPLQQPAGVNGLGGLSSSVNKTVNSDMFEMSSASRSLIDAKNNLTAEKTEKTDDKKEIEKVIKLGKTVKKTLDVDDYKWGAIVALGQSMGITGEDTGEKLAQLTMRDISVYNQEFNIKTSETVKESVKSPMKTYSTSGEFWDAKFINGVRNKDFEMDSIVAYTEKKDDDDSSKAVPPTITQNIRLKDADADAILMVAEGMKEGNGSKIAQGLDTFRAADTKKDPKDMSEDELTEHYAKSGDRYRKLYRENYAKVKESVFSSSKFFEQLLKNGGSVVTSNKESLRIGVHAYEKSDKN